MLANLTGALRLLTGLGWPMIYGVAAVFYRRNTGRPMRRIELEDEHAIEVVGLLVPLVYIFVVLWKGRLDPVDGVVLTLMYGAYLWVLSHMPPQEAESADELEAIPRGIVKSPRGVRIALITGLFAGGGALIYFMAEPFLASLLAVSALIGVSNFVFVQWVAPFVSEFPEKVSAFYWARTVDKAPMALMNMVSSNINQWTLIPAMLSLVYSMSVGHPASIPFDDMQKLELMMTLGQSLVGMLFLVNMQLAWWEATVLFGLWFFQFALSPIPPGPGLAGSIARVAHVGVTWAYFAWAGVEVVRMIIGRRQPKAFRLFAKLWREHVRA
jgi:cation:H+ antiporter